MILLAFNQTGTTWLSKQTKILDKFTEHSRWLLFHHSAIIPFIFFNYKKILVRSIWIHKDEEILYLFQALLFYVPRWLWKNWEAGKVSALRMDLNLGIISEVEKKLKKKLLVRKNMFSSHSLFFYDTMM